MVVGRAGRSLVRVPAAARHRRRAVGDATRPRRQLRPQPGRAARAPAVAAGAGRPADRGGRQGWPPVAERRPRRRADGSRRVGRRSCATPGSWVRAPPRPGRSRANRGTSWGDAGCRYLVLDGVLHAIDIEGAGRFRALARDAGKVRRGAPRSSGGDAGDVSVDFEQTEHELRVIRIVRTERAPRRPATMPPSTGSSSSRSRRRRSSCSRAPPPAAARSGDACWSAPAGQIVQLGDGHLRRPGPGARRRDRARARAGAHRDRRRSRAAPSSIGARRPARALHRPRWWTPDRLAPEVRGALAGSRRRRCSAARVEGHVEVAAARLPRSRRAR